MINQVDAQKEFDSVCKQTLTVKTSKPASLNSLQLSGKQFVKMENNNYVRGDKIKMINDCFKYLNYVTIHLRKLILNE